MNSYLKQSTASQSRSIGPFLDDTDFKTAETGLTIANTDIKLMINGAASANKNSGGGTHRANGVYGITFDATDTATVGEIFVSVVVAGALPVFATFVVLEEAVYDALFAASAPGYVANAPVNVAQFGGTNGTFASGRPEVNTSHFGGTAGTFASGRPEVNTTHAAGTAWNSGAIGASTLASDTIAAAKIATGAITAAKFAAGAIDAAAIANGAIDAATFAADVDAEILSYIVDDATRIDASALNTLSGHDPGETIMGATDLGTGAGLTSLASAANLATVAGYIDTEVASIITLIGTPAGASVSADVAAGEAQTAALETDTQGIQSRIPDALDSGNIKASIKRVGTTTLQAAGTGGQGYGA